MSFQLLNALRSVSSTRTLLMFNKRNISVLTHQHQMLILPQDHDETERCRERHGWIGGWSGDVQSVHCKDVIRGGCRCVSKRLQRKKTLSLRINMAVRDRDHALWIWWDEGSAAMNDCQPEKLPLNVLKLRRVARTADCSRICAHKCNGHNTLSPTVCACIYGCVWVCCYLYCILGLALNV